MNPDQRQEPTLGDPISSKPTLPPEPHQAREKLSTGLDPAVKLALFAASLLALVIVGDKLLDRYIQYRAMQALTQELERFENTMASISADQTARIRAQRRQRADTTTGKWLAKNCIDWRRSYESMPTETAQTEMRTHCSAYERFLSSGIAPPGSPR